MTAPPARRPSSAVLWALFAAQRTSLLHAPCQSLSLTPTLDIMRDHRRATHSEDHCSLHNSGSLQESFILRGTPTRVDSPVHFCWRPGSPMTIPPETRALTLTHAPVADLSRLDEGSRAHHLRPKHIDGGRQVSARPVEFEQVDPRGLLFPAPGEGESRVGRGGKVCSPRACRTRAALQRAGTGEHRGRHAGPAQRIGRRSAPAVPKDVAGRSGWTR